ncbi:MAG TPA: serine/threonine-protein kinase [Polyangia bacterium]|nr:serine/threonine-protein kinase [Polyangia bacterium]
MRPQPPKPVADTLPSTATLPENFIPDTVLARGVPLGRYLILDCIGAGGMGVVYAAYDPELDRKVAIKLLRFSPDTAGPESQGGPTRLLREAQAAARLSHPHVIAVYDVGLYEGQVFVAMELVEGVTLDRWLRETRPTASEILAMFLQAGQGLAAAHAAGLVHRDFKPQNVLIGQDGRARVADFGLARTALDTEPPRPATEAPTPGSLLASFERLSVKLTRTDTLMGTPAYMAPEQFLNKPIDTRADQFSFCVALFEALCGVHPYGGEGFGAIVRAITEGRINEPPRNRRVPRRVLAALRRGLSVEPAARFPSMPALLDELGRSTATRRGRILLAAGVLGLVALGAVSYLHARTTRAQLCAGAADRLRDVWDAPRKQAVHARFSATGKAYAEDAFAGLVRALDVYAESWVRMHVQACEATRLRGEQSEDLLDLRMACLDGRRQELGAFVDLLAKADAKLAEKSVQAAGSLSSVEDCADIAALKAPIRPPGDARTRAAVTALRDRLASAKALFASGRYAEGLRVVQEIAPRASALKYRPLESEALFLLARFKAKTGDIKTSGKLFLQALAAGQAGHDDQAVAQAALALLYNASGQHQFERAEEWAALAQASIERLGNEPKLQGDLESLLGHLHSGQGDFPQATAHHRRALEIRERLLGPSSLLVAQSLTNLGQVYDDQGKYDEARGVHERALAIEERILGPAHPDVATVLQNLGNVLDDQGHPEEALANYRRALTIRQAALGGEENSGIANLLNNIGAVSFRLRRIPEALEYFTRSLTLRERALGADDPAVAMSLDNLGTVLFRQGRYAEALADHQRSLAIQEKALGPRHPYVSDALVGIGRCEWALHHLAESRKPLERALVLRQSTEVRPVERAEVEFTLARTLWDSRQDRPRARRLAEAARKDYAGADASPADRAEVDAWLAQHR